jgi:orotate phosphoribosyltransferase
MGHPVNPEQESRTILEKAGALVEGHFVLSSGWHSPFYVDKRRFSLRPRFLNALSLQLETIFHAENVEMVIGPERGGVLPAFDLARLLSMQGRDVMCGYAEKREGGFVLPSDYAIEAMGRRILMIEDVLTTGASIRDAIIPVRQAGGIIIGVAALCNRSPWEVTAESLGVSELHALLNIKLESWMASYDDPCPLCASGVPINVNLGYGELFNPRLKNP